MSRSDKTVKDRALAIIRELPEGSSYEDILRALRFERMIERGLADSAAGRTISSEEIQRRIESWAPDERDDDPTSPQPSIVELLGIPADAGDVELPDGNVEAMWRREVEARQRGATLPARLTPRRGAERARAAARAGRRGG